MLKTVLDDLNTHSDALDTLFDFNRPRGSWRIQRPDGQFWKATGGWDRRDEWTPSVEAACTFPSETSAQHLIDINQGSDAGRKAFTGCRPVNVGAVVEGDHVVCACGQLHERDFCPTAAGHGMVL